MAALSSGRLFAFGGGYSGDDEVQLSNTTKRIFSIKGVPHTSPPPPCIRIVGLKDNLVFDTFLHCFGQK